MPADLSEAYQTSSSADQDWFNAKKEMDTPKDLHPEPVPNQVQEPETKVPEPEKPVIPQEAEKKTGREDFKTLFIRYKKLILFVLFVMILYFLTSRN
jgi:hypothetical protein